MNLLEILKNVPKGTKLYSPIFGELEFGFISPEGWIKCYTSSTTIGMFYPDGKYSKEGECMLFPSKENRDWNTFKKFDTNTLKPFDKVLARDTDLNIWVCKIYSHYRNTSNYRYICTDNSFIQCIPYNDETKHLVGTNKDCPEYFKTW